jgi:hypothetical protein
MATWPPPSAPILPAPTCTTPAFLFRLGFHDDPADLKSIGPVLRESTRLSCMFVTVAPTSDDPRFIRSLFRGTDTNK